ncbi:MAG: winged helix-turn-helix transcriptional regulator, partial [Hyphomicrobiaceae bacterium]|nr:winged helix-turn-helix transcriptional regulator [Hyphomicrobiaceae bacterium]
IRLKLLIDGGQTSTSTVLQEGDLKLDIVNRDVLIGDEPVSLTARERSVLQMLMRDSGMAISKTILAGRISTMEEEIAPQTVETYIHGLRKKLKDSVVDIHTVRGAGYLLKES